MRQKNDISECRLFYSRHGRWVAVHPVRGHLTPKLNTTFFFNHKLDVEYFLSNFFQKKHHFVRKAAKKCFGGTLDQFLGKGGVLPQKLT